MSIRRPVFALASLTLLLAAAPFPARGTGGMVASDHALAAEAGARILAQGGNAADAAVATALAAGVVQPAGSGLGGGGFAVTVDGERREVLDFREVAPAAAHDKLFLDAQGEVVKGASRTGGLAVGVPGEARGLAQLLRDQGTLGFRRVAAPAIELAMKGFAVHPHLAEGLERYPQMAALFSLEQAPVRGERVRRRDLGRTLKAWARSGGEALNVGPIAEEIASTVQAEGGVITAQDLADYQVREREPLVGSYRGYTVVTMPPPSSGGAVLLQVLAVLEGYELQDMGHNSSAHLHLLGEAMAHAYADRAAFMGDPDFAPVPVDAMLDPARIAEIQGLIDPQGRLPDREAYGAPNAMPADAGTQHISVVDDSGMAVALTTTINTSFGSKVLTPDSGLLLNNEMDDFVALPGVPNAFGLIGREANAVQAGKRPLSSMTPTVVLDPQGRVVMAVGASGGPLIISSTLQVISNVVDFGMDPEDAVSAPRMHHQWVPEKLQLEPQHPADVRVALEARGHELKIWEFWSAVQLVLVDEQGFSGAADPRKGGAAVPAR